MHILDNYLKSKRVQKALTTKPGEEGFSLVELVVVIAVLAILSAVAIPAFTNVQANARASAVQNGLVNKFDEIVLLHFDAHADLRQEYQGEKFSHASAIRRCLDYKNLKVILSNYNSFNFIFSLYY